LIGIRSKVFLYTKKLSYKYSFPLFEVSHYTDLWILSAIKNYTFHGNFEGYVKIHTKYRVLDFFKEEFKEGIEYNDNDNFQKYVK
jgi:hypothetical protein